MVKAPFKTPDRRAARNEIHGVESQAVNLARANPGFNQHHNGGLIMFRTAARKREAGKFAFIDAGTRGL